MLPVTVGPSTALWWGGCLNCGGVKLMLGQAATSPMCSTAPMGRAALPMTGCRQRSPTSTGRLPHAAISQQLCLAWPGLTWPPPPCLPPRVARHPQLTVECPSTRGWHSHRGGEAGTALDCPPWLCSVLFLLLPVPCALLSLCPPLGTTSLPPSPSYRLVNNSAGFCARCTLSCLWRDRWFWAESVSCLRGSRLAG